MRLVSVDLQNDFVSPGGVHYRGQPCVDFVGETLIPFCRDNGVPVAEIVSDYRTEGGNEADTTCVPGQWGYQSAIQEELKLAPPWVKASIGPTWVRDGGGDSGAVPGPVRSDPEGFTSWLRSALGPADDGGPVIIVGLVLEVCVLATLIEIKLRGYPAQLMLEGVDTYDGDPARKQAFLDTLAGFWGPPVSWADCVPVLSAARS